MSKDIEKAVDTIEEMVVSIYTPGEGRENGKSSFNRQITRMAIEKVLDSRPHAKDIEGIVETFNEDVAAMLFGESEITNKQAVDIALRKALQSQADQYETEKGEMVADIIKMADQLELECGKDGDKGTRQWMNFKGFRNTIRDKYGVDLSE